MKTIQIIAYPKSGSTKLAQLLSNKLGINGYHEPPPYVLKHAPEMTGIVIVKHTVDDNQKINQLLENDIVDLMEKPIIFITLSPTELFLNYMKQFCKDGYFNDDSSQNEDDYFGKLQATTDYVKDNTISCLKTMQHAWLKLKEHKTLCVTKDDLMTDLKQISNTIIQESDMPCKDSTLKLAPIVIKDEVTIDELFQVSENPKYWLMYDDPWVDKKARNDEYFLPSYIEFDREKKIAEISQILFNKNNNNSSLYIIEKEITDYVVKFEEQVKKENLDFDLKT